MVVQWRDIPVIVLTSNEEEETGGEMLVLGAEDCLRKPLTDAVLRMRINKVCVAAGIVIPLLDCRCRLTSCVTCM